MRSLLKHFVINTACLYLISLAVSGIVFENGFVTLCLTGLVLMLVTMIIKPILNILLLPFNLVTFGLFKWVSFAITFYLVTLIVPGFRLTDFVYPGLNSYWLSLPAINLSGTMAFLAFAFLISFVSSVIYWIFK